MKSILASGLLVMALLVVPGAAMAATDDTDNLSTADLLAQAQDPAVAGSTADPAAAPEAVPAAATGFPPDQLEQLVAPIALYPDALLMQILMASTYPLEIVEADRWMRQNPDLKGEALDKGLLEKDWDPSVESLCTLPDVLKKMSENLDWTQDLGDAFLEQEDETLDTVQRLRGKAYDAGNLKTSEQQVVTQQEDKIIIIESSSPEVVYVPTYSPTVVYGVGWGYPYWYYPPMYPYYPPGYGMVAFGAGIVVGAAIWGGCRWGWGGSNVNININRYNNFNRNTNINSGRNQINPQSGRNGQAGWQHDSSHRKGVNYKSPQTAQKHGGTSGSNRVTSQQARGHSSGATGGRQTAGTSQAGNRAGASQTNRAGTSQANRSGATQSSRSGASQSSRSNSAYSGSRNSSAARSSSYRGASSRGSYSYGGSRGGMRAGGGRRR